MSERSSGNSRRFRIGLGGSGAPPAFRLAWRPRRRGVGFRIRREGVVCPASRRRPPSPSTGSHGGAISHRRSRFPYRKQPREPHGVRAPASSRRKSGWRRAGDALAMPPGTWSQRPGNLGSTRTSSPNPERTSGTSPRHARGCARRVNKSNRAVRRPVAGNLDRATDVVPGGRVGFLPFDEQFVLLDKSKRLVDLSGVSVRAQPDRLRDADG